MTSPTPPNPQTQRGAGFRFRDVALTAYGPTVANAVGHGAVMPVLALHARELGAGVSMAAFVVALLGVGMMIASLPVGALVARIGERRTLIYGGLIDAVAMTAAFLTDSVAGLGAAILVSGMTWSAFLLSRQGYMIDVVPEPYRARALSALGASHRVGVLVGPLLGAAVIGLGGTAWVFALAGVMSLCAVGLAWRIPDHGSELRAQQNAAGRASVLSVLFEHRGTLLTLGVAVIVIGSARSLRTTLLPLWTDHVGLDASTTSLIFAVAAAVDIVFFVPGGWLMDRVGRMVVAIPVVLSTALVCLVLPLAQGTLSITALMLVMAAGNGLGSGIVMTLGADTAPVAERSQYLGGWRLCGDLGNSGAPLLVGGIAAVAPLAVVCLLTGLIGLAGTGWTAYWTGRLDRRRRAATAPAPVR